MDMISCWTFNLDDPRDIQKKIGFFTHRIFFSAFTWRKLIINPANEAHCHTSVCVLRFQEYCIFLRKWNAIYRPHIDRQIDRPLERPYILVLRLWSIEYLIYSCIVIQTVSTSKKTKSNSLWNRCLMQFSFYWCTSKTSSFS